MSLRMSFIVSFMVIGTCLGSAFYDRIPNLPRLLFAQKRSLPTKKRKKEQKEKIKEPDPQPERPKTPNIAFRKPRQGKDVKAPPPKPDEKETHIPVPPALIEGETEISVDFCGFNANVAGAFLRGSGSRIVLIKYNIIGGNKLVATDAVIPGIGPRPVYRRVDREQAKLFAGHSKEKNLLWAKLEGKSLEAFADDVRAVREQAGIPATDYYVPWILFGPKAVQSISSAYHEATKGQESPKSATLRISYNKRSFTTEVVIEDKSN